MRGDQVPGELGERVLARPNLRILLRRFAIDLDRFLMLAKLG
jgi:hypothetical protein